MTSRKSSLRIQIIERAFGLSRSPRNKNPFIQFRCLPCPRGGDNPHLKNATISVHIPGFKPLLEILPMGFPRAGSKRCTRSQDMLRPIWTDAWQHKEGVGFQELRDLCVVPVHETIKGVETRGGTREFSSMCVRIQPDRRFLECGPGGHVRDRGEKHLTPLWTRSNRLDFNPIRMIAFQLVKPGHQILMTKIGG